MPTWWSVPLAAKASSQPSVRSMSKRWQFHFGMEPVELVGEDVDRDNDGVINEVTIGQISALHIFNTTLTPPLMHLSSDAQAGQELFEHIGCADCHIPALTTTSPMLTYSFPEVPTDPTANVFYRVDLRDYPAFFEEAEQGGIIVPLFADLKRHDMGPGLAESFGEELAAQFTTARLWGVADTAPLPPRWASADPHRGNYAPRRGGAGGTRRVYPDA